MCAFQEVWRGPYLSLSASTARLSPQSQRLKFQSCCFIWRGVTWHMDVPGELCLEPGSLLFSMLFSLYVKLRWCEHSLTPSQTSCTEMSLYSGLTIFSIHYISIYYSRDKYNSMHIIFYSTFINEPIPLLIVLFSNYVQCEFHSWAQPPQQPETQNRQTSKVKVSKELHEEHNGIAPISDAC